MNKRVINNEGQELVDSNGSYIASNQTYDWSAVSSPETSYSTTSTPTTTWTAQNDPETSWSA